MDQEAVAAIVQYLQDIHAKDNEFFKQLVSGARVSGRLFFDLQIGGAALNSQENVTVLMKNNASVAAAKVQSLDAVKNMQATLNIDTISSLQDFSSRHFQQVVRSDGWNNITAGMESAEVANLQRLLAGALTYKIASEAVNPHLTDPVIRGNMKLFTAIVNMPHAPEIILQMRTDEYKKAAITDPLSQTESNLINYINTNNNRSFMSTLDMLANMVAGIDSRLEFKYLGDSGRSILGVELGKLHSHLSNMDSKKVLNADQSALRDTALNRIEQIARDNQLSLSALRPSLPRGASSSLSSSPSFPRRKEGYASTRQGLDRSSPQSTLASSASPATATAAAAASGTTDGTPQQLQDEQRPMEKKRAATPPPRFRGGS